MVYRVMGPLYNFQIKGGQNPRLPGKGRVDFMYENNQEMTPNQFQLASLIFLQDFLVFVYLKPT